MYVMLCSSLILLPSPVADPARFLGFHGTPLSDRVFLAYLLAVLTAEQLQVKLYNLLVINHSFFIVLSFSFFQLAFLGLHVCGYTGYAH